MVLTPRKQRLRSLPSNRTCARQRIPTTSHWVRNLFLKHLHSLIAFFHRPKHHIVYFRFVKKTKTFHRKLLDAYANIHLAFVLISSNECFITWKFHITNTAEPILYECFFFLHFVWQLNSDSETLVLWNGWSVDDTLVSLYSSKFTFQRPNGDFFKSDLISTRMKSNKYIGRFLLCKVV